MLDPEIAFFALTYTVLCPFMICKSHEHQIAKDLRNSFTPFIPCLMAEVAVAAYAVRLHSCLLLQGPNCR